jgi:hypothetical protein
MRQDIPSCIGLQTNIVPMVPFFMKKGIGCSSCHDPMRRLLVTFVGISLILRKLTVCVQTIDFDSIASYFWFPSLWVQDVLFVLLVDASLSMTSTYSVSVFLWTASVIAVVCTIGICTAEVTFWIGHGFGVPWDRVPLAWYRWEEFQSLISSKAEEGTLKVWMALIGQLSWTIIFGLFTNTCRKKLCHYECRSRLHIAKSISLTGTTGAPSNARGFTHSRTAKMSAVALSIIYSVSVLLLRPSIPYTRLSMTPFLKVALEVTEGFQEYHKLLRAANSKDSSGDHNKWWRTEVDTMKQLVQRAPFERDYMDEPINVVLVFLESVRADMMPFDGSTPWARRFVPNVTIHDKITPFYNQWVRNSNSTLYIPHMKSASGFTHKSLASTLCSLHALPLPGTVEHAQNLYHPCLPQILDRLGYQSQFFKSLTETFDHQNDLMRNIGYPRMYGRESYDLAHNVSAIFQRDHKANYFGYEDIVLLDTLTEWVENQTKPFFLSYLSGITHDPYEIPPRGGGWKAQSFSPDYKANGYLNEVSYLDTWLELLVKSFEDRHLMDSTLFVFLGDHGGHFKDRDSKFTTFGQKYEEAFDVGVTFHSRNPRIQGLLQKAQVFVSGNWSSLDIAPTLLEILFGRAVDPMRVVSEKGLKNSPYSKYFDSRASASWVDGRSMLRESGSRLRLSVGNPGESLILRDMCFLLVFPLKKDDQSHPEAFNICADPGQHQPLQLLPVSSLSKPKSKLEKWGQKAMMFCLQVKLDLVRAHETGMICQDCALEKLVTLETLESWSTTVERANLSDASAV